MGVRVTCPSCGRRLRIPSRLAGLPTICPECKDTVPVPPAAPPPEEVAAAAAPRPPSEPEEPDVMDLPWHGRLGVLSAALGLLSVPALCLPFVGYVALLLSGLGLLAGLYALVGAWLDGSPGPGLSPAAGGVARVLGARAVYLPLAGVAACLVGLVLTLGPLLVW